MGLKGHLSILQPREGSIEWHFKTEIILKILLPFLHYYWFITCDARIDE